MGKTANFHAKLHNRVTTGLATAVQLLYTTSNVRVEVLRRRIGQKLHLHWRCAAVFAPRSISGQNSQKSNFLGQKKVEK